MSYHQTDIHEVVLNALSAPYLKKLTIVICQSRMSREFSESMEATTRGSSVKVNFCAPYGQSCEILEQVEEEEYYFID
jgi:undecaprenyl pyrophosphate synthase